MRKAHRVWAALCAAVALAVSGCEWIEISLTGTTPIPIQSSTVTPLIVTPEWYFLPLFSILRCFPDEVTGIVLMFGAIAIFYFLPWLDTSNSRFRHHSPWIKAGFFFWIINMVWLGWMGSKALVGPGFIDWLFGRSAEPGWIRPLSQLSTVLYFAWFVVVLPCRRWLEKQEPRQEKKREGQKP